jgi:hypothetical protein
MLHDEVVRAVAVQIADADTIHAPHIVAQRDAASARHGRRRPGIARRRRPLTAAHDGGHAVSAVGRGVRVEEVRGRDDRLCREAHFSNARVRPVDVKPDVARIRVEQPPAHAHPAIVGPHRDDAAIERFADARGRPPERRARLVERIHRVEVQVRRDLFRRQRAEPLLVVLRRTRRRRRRYLRRRLLRHGRERRDDHGGHQAGGLVHGGFCTTVVHRFNGSQGSRGFGFRTFGTRTPVNSVNPVNPVNSVNPFEPRAASNDLIYSPGE